MRQPVYNIVGGPRKGQEPKSEAGRAETERSGILGQGLFPSPPATGLVGAP